MYRLSVKRMGFAGAMVGVLSYAGCMAFMKVLPEEIVIRVSNSLMHGLDVTPIMRSEVPMTDSLIGIVEIGVLGFLAGAALALFYNLSGGKVKVPNQAD